MMVTTQLSGVSSPFSLRLANGIVLSFYFVCLVEVEQKEVRALSGFEPYLLFVIERRSIAGRELFSVQVEVACDQLHPGVALLAQREIGFHLGIETANGPLNGRIYNAYVCDP